MKIIGHLKNFFRIIGVSAKRYYKDQHDKRAVVLTYNTIFAIVPLAALFFGIAKGFSMAKHLEAVLADRFAGQQEVFQYISRFAEKTLEQTSGGIVAGVGVIALIWTVMLLILNIENAFNAIWNIPAKRNWWRRISDYLAILILTPILMVTVSAAGVMIRKKLFAAAENISILNTFSIEMLELAARVVPVMLIMAVFLLIYRFAPAIRVRWKSALVAAVTAGILYQLLQDGFLYLQGTIFRYNRVYGSFAIFPLFLVWLNWSWQIILFGGEITYVNQNIKSGIFDENLTDSQSRLSRQEHQLTILGKIFRHFESYNGAFPESDLFVQLHLPEVILRDELSELINLGLLCRVEKEDGTIGLMPVVPPSTFTVIEFLHRIYGQGESSEVECKAGVEMFNYIDRELTDTLNGRLVKDI